MLTPPVLPAGIPAGVLLATENIIGAIPPPDLPPKIERSLYVILGKPGCGKSTLASRISKRLMMDLVNPEEVIYKLILSSPPKADSDEDLNEENADMNSPPLLHKRLLQGKAIDHQQVLHMIDSTATSDSALYNGLILDGLPFSNTHDSACEEPGADLELLRKLIANLGPNLRLVLINLQIGDEDLITRRLSQVIDPFTGNIYPADQIAYSIRRRAEGWEEGTIDATAAAADETEEENWSFDYNLDDEAPVKGDDDDGWGAPNEQDGGGEDANDGVEGAATGKPEKRKRRGGEPKQLKLQNKSVWPILPVTVVDRVIKRPEDTKMMIEEQLAVHTEIENKLQDIRTNLFDKLSIVSIDATQHPDLVFRNAMERLESLGFCSGLKPVLAKKLPIPDGNFRGVSEADTIKYLLTHDLEDGEPPRSLSIWGRYCPVTCFRDRTLVTSPLLFPVLYRGNVFFLASDSNTESFIANPDKYLSKPPQVPSLKLCILGGPFTGKTSQGKMLAQLYGLKLLCLDDILSEWDSDPDQKQLLRKNATYAKIVKRCKAGRSVPPELLVEVIKLVLEGLEPSQSKGWILDGFPRTLDQVTAMIEADLIPQYAIVLTNDINDEAVRMRVKLHEANSRTGKQWNETPRVRPAEFPAQISRTATPAGRPSSIGRPKQSGGDPQSSHGGTSEQFATNTLEEAPLSPLSMPPRAIYAYPFFDNLFNGFREEFNSVIRQLEEKKGVAVVNIGAEQAIPTILSIILSAVDPFIPKAEILNPKQLAELPTPIELGFTKDYCPFALRQANILQKGVPQYTVKYLSQIYYLSSDEARVAFALEPHNFVNFKELINPPPPRLFILGPSGSGKSTCINALARWNVPSLGFNQLIEEFSKVAEQDVRDEIEYMMRENAGLLSPVIIQDMILHLFHKEPYASRGFILEGFPRTKVDLEVIIKHNLFVDAVINLAVDPEVAARRILNDFKQRERELKVKAEEIAAVEGPTSPNYANALVAIKEISKRIDHPEDELNAEFIDQVEKETMLVQEVVSSVEGFWSVPVIEIDCNKCARPIMSSLKKQLTSIFENRRSMFSNAISIEKAEAETLLRLGTKSYSAFGKSCPVSMHESKSVLVRKIGTYPVIYGKNIYFLRSQKCREKFIQNTYTYINQPPPKPVVRPRICILGRPKSGKSVMASKLATELEIVHLTIPVVVQSLLSENDGTALSKQISETLSKGLELPDELVNEALLLVMSRGVCQARGWVLDGYPQTQAQAEYLEARGLVPDLFIKLDLMDSLMIRRMLTDFDADIQSGTPRLNFETVIRDRDEQYQKEIGTMQAYFDLRYANWMTIDASKSRWALKDQIKNLLEGGTTRRQNYVDLRTKGRAAPVGDIGISLISLRRQMGKFGDYCPVSLLDRGELVKGPEDTRYTAEYQDKYYRMATLEDLEVFLASPERYIEGPDLPENLPQHVPASALVFPRQLELQGYCPVTYQEGPVGFGSIVPGSLEFVVEYEKKYYALASQEQLEKFLRTPWNYINLELPRKLPPKLSPIPLASLPLVGYLEQSVAKIITEALTAVGKSRPKHPYHDLERSACEYLALYMKANNAKSKAWVQKDYKVRLESFKDKCQLIEDLKDVAVSSTFIPPESRSEQLKTRLKLFSALKPI